MTDVLIGSCDVEPEEEFNALVGVTEFANKCKGVHGIMKQRYSDFIVREILTDGTVACLSDMCGKSLEERWFASGTSDSTDSAEDTVKFITKSLQEQPIEEDVRNLTHFIQLCMEKNADCPESYTAFPDLDKVTRTAMHGAIKGKLAEYIETETVQVDGKSMIKMIALHKRSGKGNKRKRAEWPQGLSNFLRFTLMKENIDTMSAVGILEQGLRCGSGANGVTYSGTKDKRGVTVQKCTVYRRKPSDFTRINASTRLPTILCGDFEYVNEPAVLGDGNGNRFEIVLRAVDTSNESEIVSACTAMQSSGFINYYGLQRFGKGGTKSHEFGKAILKSDWESCVRMLFTPRSNDRPNVAAAKELFMQNDYAGAVKMMPEQLQSEKHVLQRLINHPTDFQAAYAGVPKSARLMCAHAYQSYLWNKAASRKLQLHGATVVEGDLVLLPGPMKGEGVQRPSMNASAALPVHTVSAEDVAAGKFSVDDIILPVPGAETVYPSNEIGAYYDELLAADGLSRASYAAGPAVYKEGGAYRKLIQRPGDFEWKAIPYDNPDAELAETELVRFRTEPPGRSAAAAAPEGEADPSSEVVSADSTAGTPKFWALQLKFSLPPGTYATMLLREITKSSTESQFQAQLTRNAASNV
jgi:tRNA pseudouridine13 synthase